MARHDVAAFGETLAPDYVAVFGDGAFIKSRAACLHAFQSTFTAVPFEHVITYERITDKVELRDNHHLAAEHGHWIGRLPSGQQTYTGSYLAMWRKDPKGWKLRSELFITLSGGR
jgi:ketosteroid isomerase-like protein